MLLVRRVVGRSMVPTLRPGQIVIASKLIPRLRTGCVVIIQHNGLEKIKRVVKVRDDQFFVQGDNFVDSTDSRHFGWLPKNYAIARVVWPRITNVP